MTWGCAYFIEVMLNWFLLELWSFNYFSAVSLVSATSPTVFKGFWWNFAVIVPMTWKCAYYTKVTFNRFLPELWPFVSFSNFINSSSFLRNSSYSFRGISMNLSRYCCYDLKMWIFHRSHARLIFTRVMALKQFFSSKSCLCNSSRSFQWILVKLSSYCSHDLKRIILYWGHAWSLFTRVMALCQF